jgi:DNA-binding IclR family transcriptional regulator
LPKHERLESFIANSFRSVWALELLRHLAENPDRLFTSEELIAALRASDAVVSKSVDNLTAAGLAIVDDEGRVGYHEASAEQGALVKEAIDFYGRSPDKVRRLIVAQSAPGVTAFADAFKLRKD